ncbi:stage III sporulation protein AC [Sulfoacidibacillus thermotolerans]|uniref:Stage III sporulation protein AC n=1 Tax=Sulfoacidibacillus thermotolerans TaxID=1765684 RepID=A0A2U3DBZ0_SULT2|nr:stage III sporulation protein AC [Sulfoacidibacillus thermotolerans]PWI58794.1 stage III sporulation protein AC [Sulfoacidibacillus thermotolerans]
MSLELHVIFQIAVVGIAAAVLSSLLKQSGRDEIATLVTISALVLVAAVVVTNISHLFMEIRDVFSIQ